MWRRNDHNRLDYDAMPLNLDLRSGGIGSPETSMILNHGPTCNAEESSVFGQDYELSSLNIHTNHAVLETKVFI